MADNVSKSQEVLLLELSTRIQELTDQVNKIGKSCKRMETHISFVEKIYEKSKGLFQRILGYERSPSDEVPETGQKRMICDI